MQKGHFLQFCCQACNQPVSFSVFTFEGSHLIQCEECGVVYNFNKDLQRQLRTFDSLCRQIQLSEEILSNTSVGIYLGDREVKIPYKLLLTRLNSTLDLVVGDKPLTVSFRMEPVNDTPKRNVEPMIF